MPLIEWITLGTNQQQIYDFADNEYVTSTLSTYAPLKSIVTKCYTFALNFEFHTRDLVIGFQMKYLLNRIHQNIDYIAMTTSETV